MSKEYLSRRVLELAPSATLAMNARAKKLQAEGKKVISFSVGEPDFKTPKHICDAAKAAIEAGMHSYTACPGIPELRSAVATALYRDIGVRYAPEEIVASPGGKYSVYLTMMALLNPGDEVIVPAPYWVSYPEMVKLCGAVPVFVGTNEEDGFSLSPEMLDRAVTPKTKMAIINSPSNPTGQILSPKVVSGIGEVLEKRGLWCLSDEIYDKLIYAGSHKSVASVSPYCRDHTVVVNGCSKTYAMTGWRLGWTASPKPIAAAIDNIQSQTTSNTSSIVQAAGVAALNGPQDCVETMRLEFAERRKLLHHLLNGIPGVTCSMPTGAFYALPNVKGVFGREMGGKKIVCPLDLCEALLEQAYVAAVPGEAFGAPEHIRISYATSRGNIEEGCRRMGEALSLSKSS